MSTEGASKKQNFSLSVRSTDLGAPTLVDQIAAELLDHLCVCRTCLAVFAAQQESLETAGCTEGIRIVSHSQLKWEERRATLALTHITDESLDDYLFGRLTSEEEAALNHHATVCLPCANAILQREALIDSIKSVMRPDPKDTRVHSETFGAVSVRIPNYSFGISRSLTLGRRHLLVVVNRSNSLLTLTRSQLKFFFLRVIAHWPWGTEVLPVDLPDSSEMYIDFAKLVLKVDPANIDLYWLDRSNLQGRQRPLVVADSKEMKRQIASHPGAIGYLCSDDLDDTVKVITVK